MTSLCFKFVTRICGIASILTTWLHDIYIAPPGGAIISKARDQSALQSFKDLVMPLCVFAGNRSCSSKGAEYEPVVVLGRNNRPLMVK